MNGADDTAYPAPATALIALTRLLGRLAAQEHMKQQKKLPANNQLEEKPCK